MKRWFSKGKELFDIRSLRGLLRFFTLFLLAIPALLTVLIAYYEYDDQKHEAFRHINHTVSMQTEIIDNWFTQKAAELRGLAQMEFVQHLDKPMIKHNFQVFLSNHSDFSWVAFVNTEGLTEIEYPLEKPVDVRDRNYFHRSLRGQEHISDVLISRATGEPVVTLSWPLFNETGEFKGLVIGTVNLSTIALLMENYRFGEEEETYLVDREGKMITRSGFSYSDSSQNPLPELNMVNTEGFQKVLRGEIEGSAYRDYRGQRVIGVSQFIPKLGWAVISEMDEQELLSPFYRKIALFFGTYVILLLVVLPSIRRVSERIEMPIQRMMLVSRMIQAGKYEQLKCDDSCKSEPRELSLLCHTIQQMATTIVGDMELLNQSNRTLMESETKYRSLVQNAIFGVYVLQNDRFQFVNPRFAEFFDYTEEEVLAMSNYLQLIHPESREQVQEDARRRLTSQEEPTPYEIRGIKKDGTSIYLEVLGAPVSYEGKPAILGTVVDITRRKLADEAVREKEARFRTLVESIRDLVFTLDMEGRITATYGKWPEAADNSPTQIIGKHIGQVIADTEPFWDGEQPQLWAQRGDSIFVEWTMHLPEGTRFYHISLSPIGTTAGDVIGMVGIGRDMTERRQMEEQLRYYCSHDPLTGLYNRAHFQEEMSRLAGSTSPVGVIICDVDGLKSVNDTLGHPVGDMLLTGIGQALTRCVRASDVVARIGGDEFAILLPEGDGKAAQRISQRIRLAVDALNVVHPELPHYVSLGYAVKVGAEKSMIEVFRDADDNMYREKMRHKSRVRKIILRALTMKLDTKERDLMGHMQRVGDLAARLGAAAGLRADQVDNLRLAGEYHDVGKVAVSRDILGKKGMLAPEEYLEVQRHSEVGYRIAQLKTEIAHVAEWILFHHERWDGSGYPQQLAREGIPFESRILAIVDAYDVMTHNQPYRHSLTPQEAVAELRRFSGTQFDPQLVGIFVGLIESMIASTEEGKN
ncbi:diguanylate cyclase [Heliobacillus mobilis]|uniref:Diguanylate cyclase n=1 Tax=Heliobacterium mobile TaxID=28064 RepID=A0A6I3SLX6_HELMO|nr:diguanylate cyclase [Heliobacterium mobile]MTV49968.1 diguanylate cyclase [Heliobacterium mobile]